MTHRARSLLAFLVAVLPGPAGPDSPTLRPSDAPTTPGIDVLLADSAALIAGMRLGLITNQTGVDARGVSTIDRLFNANRPDARFPVPGSRLVALFAPEHGIRGLARPGETVNDTTDTATGLPIYSLYGTNRAPTGEQMRAIDVLLVDLQDVGARTFTNVSTMIYAMRAAAAAGRRIIVLDRPNPIGCAMEGPVLDPAHASFIGMLPVPLRHGLTIGELARFANDVLEIHADLAVVPVRGWRRCMWFDETGLPWVRPSPNLPDLEAVAWYPGTVLFEATSLSVGRGSDAPFRQVGAPWLRRPRGRGWRPVTFTPRAPGDGKFAGAVCRGVRLGRFDRRRGSAVATALALLDAALAANRDSLRVDERGMALRLGRSWRPGFAADEGEVAAFRARVQPYLLYREIGVRD